MIKYEELCREVKDRLSDARFRHSMRVVDRALEYARVYNVDYDVVRLVAMGHDIAKELSYDEMIDYIEEYDIELNEIERNNFNLLHAKIGAYICKDKYGFSEDMVNAVMYHTTGRANMSMLEKIIYLADATEDGRNYDKKWYVDLIINDIDKGMFEVSKWVINNLLDNNRQIHIDSINCYNYYNKY